MPTASPSMSARVGADVDTSVKSAMIRIAA